MSRLKTLARNEAGVPPLAGGHSLCQGCGVPLVVRTVLNTFTQPVVVVNATGCLEVATTRFPTTAWNVPWIHVAFENAAAVAGGVESAQRALRRRHALLARSLGHAHDSRRQRPDEPLDPKKDPAGEAAVRRERPAVHREDANGHAGERSRDASEHAHLRAVRVDDVRPQPPAEPHELDEPECVVPGMDRPADVLQLDERHPSGLGRLAQRPRALRGQRDLEPLGQTGQEERDRRLGASELAQRDQDEQAGPGSRHLPS